MGSGETEERKRERQREMERQRECLCIFPFTKKEKSVLDTQRTSPYISLDRTRSRGDPAAKEAETA